MSVSFLCISRYATSSRAPPSTGSLTRKFPLPPLRAPGSAMMTWRAFCIRWTEQMQRLHANIWSQPWLKCKTVLAVGAAVGPVDDSQQAWRSPCLDSGHGRLQWILLLCWLLSSCQPPESVDGYLLLSSSLTASPSQIHQPPLMVAVLLISAGFPPKPTLPPASTTTRDPLADFCRGRPDGLYENAADKTTFLQCFNGITYVQRCQLSLVYVDGCKCCNWP